MKKSLLRTLYKNKRKELTSAEINSLSLKIFENLKSMSIWNFHVFHLFLSIRQLNEVNTDPILQYLYSLQKRVVVPKVINNEMIGVEIGKDVEIEIGKFNVPEPKSSEEFNPKEIEVMFVPLLVCDQNGNRVGYGAGYYDEFLKECRSDLLKIGISFFEPISSIEDINSMDVPLDYCVTPVGIVSFTGDLLISEK